MLGVVQPLRQPEEGKPRDIGAVLDELSAKIGALQQQPAPDMAPALALLAEAVAAMKATPAPVVKVAAPDNGALARALASLSPKAPCAYHFSVTARDANGKISEMVARPMAPEKEY
jgi:hypothetical protein